MSRKCMVSGAQPGFGHSISHSHVRNKRRFNVNVQKKRYYVPSLGRTVRLTISPRGMRIVDRRGIDAVVRDLIACGVKV